MRWKPLAASVTALLACSCLVGPAAQATPFGRPAIVADSTVERIPLGEFTNRQFPGSVADDHGIAFGGLGSGLYPTGRRDEFWMVTDRGPNGQIKVGKDKRRTFPVPGFDPSIVRVRTSGGTARVLQSIPITGRSGKPVTGLSNTDGRDEVPYDWNAQQRVAYNSNGMDVEDIVLAKDGTFWIVDEYSPSLVHVDQRGKVITRYVPKGLGLTGTDYPVVESLPGVLLSRKANRGFEGLTISPDGHTLYLAVQSPLSLPDAKGGDASRNTRILAFDTRRGRVTAEHVYRFENVDEFDPAAAGKPAEMKISGLAALDPFHLVVLERTDAVARLYVVDLLWATNVLGRVDDPVARPSLEELDAKGLSAARITPLPKRLGVDLAALPGMPGKVESVAILDRFTVVVANDNDFGMRDGTEAFDANGRLVDTGIRSRVLKIKLGWPLF